MMKYCSCLFGVVAGLVVSARSSYAGQLANIGVVGSTDGVTFSSALTGLTPNSPVSYEVVLSLIPGSTNGTKTLNTTQTPHPDTSTANYDGWNNLEFNLSAAGGGSFASGSIFSDGGADGSDFTKITGSGIGSSTGTSFTDVKTGLAPGFYEGADANHLAVIFSGTFNYTGGAETIVPAYDGQAGFEFNSNPSTGTATLADKINISGSDTNGYLGIIPLTLTAVPEPGTVSIILAGGSVLLARRRRCPV